MKYQMNSYCGFFYSSGGHIAHKQGCGVLLPSANPISAEIESKQIFSACPVCLPVPSQTFHELEPTYATWDRDEILEVFEMEQARRGTTTDKKIMATLNEYEGWWEPSRESERFANGGAVAFVTPKGNKFHRADCHLLRTIKTEDIEEFSVDLLHFWGYGPCSVCKADEL